ncbi:MAG: DEAD/DEAH box helicase [Bdellovibrionales bacterium]|nr:DEAD/DEAH box helicase [Bdellovibrionales bacterium]
MTFQDLDLPPFVMKAIDQLGFQNPTEIQTAVFADVFAGTDLIASAQTGSGKTAAFCVPIISRLIENPASTALVLAPTRELALQIDEFWKQLTLFARGFPSACLIGGVSMQAQDRMLRKQPRIIIATPGRLLDHIRRRTVRLMKSTSILVLDEADRMLDMGFRPQLTAIRDELPKSRQTLLFSATWSPEMDSLSKEYLREPKRIAVGTVSKVAPTISSRTITTSQQKKNETLLEEVGRLRGQVLIFARTQKRTDRLARYLESYGVKSACLHGGRTQGQRKAALKAFSTGESRVMVATDIAARGIDVAGIQTVINYDLPQVPEDYIHRIGRTGRAGASGEAVTFLVPEERLEWRDIVALLKKTGSQIPKGSEGVAKQEVLKAEKGAPVQKASALKAKHPKGRIVPAGAPKASNPEAVPPTTGVITIPLVPAQVAPKAAVRRQVIVPSERIRVSLVRR